MTTQYNSTERGAGNKKPAEKFSVFLSACLCSAVAIEYLDIWQVLK